MRSRSSSRYITATFAPTKRNGLLPTRNRPPRWRANCFRGAPLPSEFAARDAPNNRTAALPTRISAATVNSFLFINEVSLARARHPNKPHNRADRSQHHEQIKERADTQCRRKIYGLLRHSQKHKYAKKQKVKVINNQANRGIRKPARRRTERRRARKSKHRSDQPTNTSGNQQKQRDQKKVLRLRRPELLQHQQKWEEHLSGVSPSRIICSDKKQAPSAHVSRFGLCTNGVELGRVRVQISTWEANCDFQQSGSPRRPSIE